MILLWMWVIGLWGGDIACDTLEFPVYIEGSDEKKRCENRDKTRRV